jgi:hypothetical protein
VPAYNTNKKFHQQDKGWVGYVITVNGTRIYLAGDTDLIPEMKTIKANIALLPVSGTYVMTPRKRFRRRSSSSHRSPYPCITVRLSDLHPMRRNFSNNFREKSRC